MFKELIKKLTGRVSSPRFDPTALNDPVAEQTEWTPAAGGGTNFKTHKLKKIHGQRMEFRATIGMLLFGGIFFVIGVGVGAAFVASSISAINDESRSFEPASLLLLLFAGVFGGVGFFLLRSALIPAVFDLSHGYYCKSRKKPEHSMNPSRIKGYVKLNEIHALQLISEYCSGNKSSYYSYELNLVLKDGSRINVVDHGNRSALQRDAETLASFLQLPVWNAI